jgi:molybdopterin molybdotransferase
VIRMAHDLFLKTHSFEEATHLIEEKIIIRPKIEEISINNSLNRVLATDISSPIDVPDFNRSLRDGFALIAAETFGADEDTPISLELIDEVQAGEIPSKSIKLGQCSRIATGAPIPEGADAVVMVEFTEQKRNSIKIFKPAIPMQFITKKGTDIKKDQLILKKNIVLIPKNQGTLAAIGFQKVPVYVKPKVSILSTGNELLSPKEPLTYGKIYDINAITLYNSILESQGIPVEMGIAADEIIAIESKFEEMIKLAEVIIVTGGTSKGKGDLLPEIVSNRNNIEFFIHGIRIQPGKPIIISSIKSNNSSIPIFILPGNPTSCLITYNLFVDPIIRKFTYYPLKQTKMIKAKLKQRIYPSEGRTVFQPMKITDSKEGELIIVPVKTGSESITTLANADGYIKIPEDIQYLEENEIVDFILF